MRTELMVWGGLAMVLIAAEALAPGAFMLWLGLAAAVVFVLLLVFPDLPMIGQAIAFVGLGFASITIYMSFFRHKERPSDQPLLNRRAEQLIGRVVTLDQAISAGVGRAKVDDAFWVVAGPDLPQGSTGRVVAVDGMTLKVQAV